jgi:hypothetical protein
MPRPKSKSDFLEQSQQNFKKLFDYIGNLSQEEQEQEFPEGSLNRNLRDLLAHLHHWHLMMLQWYKIGMNGEKPAMPAEGYTWKDLPALNIKINQQYAQCTLEETKEMVTKSYNDIQKLIVTHSEEELFEKKKYHWTGTTSLAAYLISATSSHYDTVLKLLRKWRKRMK